MGADFEMPPIGFATTIRAVEMERNDTEGAFRVLAAFDAKLVIFLDTDGINLPLKL